MLELKDEAIISIDPAGKPQNPTDEPSGKTFENKRIYMGKEMLGYKKNSGGPTSTCKTLNTPPKDWGKVQKILKHISFRRRTRKVFS